MGHVKNRVKITMREMDVEARRSQLELDINMYEFRYEVSSEKMQELLIAGKERKTKNVLKWMSDYRALKRLDVEFPAHETPAPEIDPPQYKKRPVAPPNRPFTTPVKKVDPEEFDANLRRSIEKFESIYEMKSEEMLHLLSDFKVRETNEILEWIQDYKYLRYLEEAPRDSEGKRIIPEMTDAEVEEYRAELKRNIINYETRYKMTSEEMLDLLDKGRIPETIEIIEWKFDLRDLRVLEEEIPISGKPTTATAPSTTSD